jgi:1-acyl-sn-glycerol-3-phosphate acyltransferase
LLSRVEGIRILAKSSLFRIPFLWPMMRLSKQIPVERGNLQSFFQAIDRVEALVTQGDTVHVFPEMTRCERGFHGTQSFSIAPFRSAMKGGFDVVPIVIEGTDEVWPKSAWGLRFRQPVRVRSLKALDPKEFSSADELMQAARGQIQSALLAGTSESYSL